MTIIPANSDFKWESFSGRKELCIVVIDKKDMIAYMSYEGDDDWYMQHMNGHNEVIYKIQRDMNNLITGNVLLDF